MNLLLIRIWADKNQLGVTQEIKISKNRFRCANQGN